MTSSVFRCRAVRLAFFSAFVVLFTAVPAFAQLRIVDYNTAAGPRNGMDEIIAGIEAEAINGIARKPDMILLQEQDSVSTTTQDILEILDSLYGVGVYQRSTVEGASQGAGHPAMIFNTQTLQKIGGEVTVGTVGDSANARQGMRYRMRPVGTGYTSSSDFYVFVDHYKAGSTSGGPTADQERRLAEAKSVRTSSDALGQVHAIYAGDFNMQSASEDAYEWLLNTGGVSPGNGVAVDPIGLGGTWHDTNTLEYRKAHTQSPTNFTPGFTFEGQPVDGSLVTAGMDDRFDFQLVTNEFMDGEGLSYIGPTVPGMEGLVHSYHAFGNNGSHPINQAINHADNNALGNDQHLLDALAFVSDHLPVVVDYQIPARMGVSSNAPGLVIRNSAANATISVQNTAPVAVQIGADELDYGATTSGDVSGSIVGGVALATLVANDHLLPLNTSTPGDKSGTVQVAATSQGAASPNSSQFISYTVFDRGDASFSSDSNVETLGIDLGDWFVGSGLKSSGFIVTNREALSGFTAFLDVTGTSGSGDTAALTTDISGTTNLGPNDELASTAFLNTATIGDFSAQWLVNVADDQQYFGAQSMPSLTLNLSGRVTHVGDFSFNFVLDAADIDLMLQSPGGPGSLYDLTGDTVVNQADADYLVEVVFGTNYGDADLLNGVDNDDMDILEANYLSNGGWAEGNFNGVDPINEDDLALLLANFTPGDVNLNGEVDIFDVGVASDHWETVGPRGDANASGLVDIFDIGVISDNWTAGGGGAQSVPEPATWLLFAVGLVGLAARAKSRGFRARRTS